MTQVLSDARIISNARLKFPSAWTSPGPCPATDIAGSCTVIKVW